MSADSPPRPKAPQTSKSFSRMEDISPGSFPRNRAKTVHGIMVPDLAPANSPLLSLEPESVEEEGDVFEKRDSADSAEGSPIDRTDSAGFVSQDMADQFELPIELASLIDRFVASLSAKVYPTPPSIDQLSDLFQDFYGRAAALINTHISTLASRLNREQLSSPSQPRNAGKAKRDSLYDSRKGAEKPVANQQMLTAEEVAEKRRARKLLQYKRHALEETVERRACEAVYDKIWRHKNTLDEVRDEKLRSKTAALSLVGIGLKDLGIEMWDLNGEKGKEASEYLESARESLIKMNDEKFPLGKLQHLTAAHKAIVDTLTKVLPSSSSADEILPTLIYTLITTPTEGINIISNMLFVQRFRTASRLDGEAAYCLTNLEAAISFLENVDLNGLRADGPQENTVKSSTGPSVSVTMRPDSPLNEDPTPNSSSSTPAPVPPDPGKATLAGRLASSESAQKSRTAESSPQRRLTDLLQPSAKALGAANDAVRTTADQGLKNISSTLDNSFNFLFGRLKEVQTRYSGEPNGVSTLVPKTLDDARRLVTTSPVIDDIDIRNEDDSPVQSTNQSIKAGLTMKQEDKLLGLIGGRKTSRQNSGDSAGNSGSGLKALLTPGETSTPTLTPSASIFSSTTGQSTPNAAFGSMKNFGNTLNPLNHIPGMIRGFGRSPPEPSSISTDKSRGDPISSRSSTPIPQKNNPNAADFKPAIKRFLEMQDAGELKMSDIPELLEDYKRLASLLNESRNS
ncbi:hypothetical protein AJ79_06378 [Helicocarpus griseus UAMH5409]|uniref:VPS9 domain-containing protein n=1 Tax=Helicocarpus griseus UAMH5409 TaxID=1447875 RepID=A0A2B7XDW4_9EURO|nr:hypothetical protein AJ79_06378 [Helicocarpus griseus UAMH5409]